MSNYSSNDVANAIAAAAKALDARKDEINRLNVFPVPDGDTGTNMSLTLAMVVENLAALPIGASNADKRRAITTGALMGARGNSGVITSQICAVCAKASMAMKISISMRSAMPSLRRSKSRSMRYASRSKVRSSRCCAIRRKRRVPRRRTAQASKSICRIS